MTLRRRIALVTALAVTLAVALAVTASYLAVRSQVYGQIDTQLRRQGSALSTTINARRLAGRPPRGERFDADRLPRLSPNQGGPFGYVQILTAGGEPYPNPGQPATDLRLPVGDADRAIAEGDRSRLLRTVEDGDDALRMLTVPIEGGGAVQLATPLASAHTVMRRLVLLLAGIGVAGIALAIALSHAVTRRVTAPVRELVDAAAHVTQTDDLALRIKAGSRDDELGLLAQRFNSMLDHLQASRQQLAGSVTAQRQLVADASHELRTPITSLRTNLELLLEDEASLDPSDRRELLASLVEQTKELGDLVVDVIDLARGDAEAIEHEPVRLDEVVLDEVLRARRHHPGVEINADVQPVTVLGSASRLARAVANLLDNAAKYGAGDRQNAICITVDDTGVSVRDHGPGIAPQDLEHLFDRFYRGAQTGQQSGSGLGLAIVRQVAELHGGHASAANHPQQGAILSMRFPTRALDAGDLNAANPGREP